MRDSLSPVPSQVFFSGKRVSDVNAYSESSTATKSKRSSTNSIISQGMAWRGQTSAKSKKCTVGLAGHLPRFSLSACALAVPCRFSRT